MILRELAASLHRPVISGDQSTEIKSITYDSRKAGPGVMFVALRGTKSDGHQFIANAITAGASAIVAETAQGDDVNVPWLHVNSSRKALAVLAATLNGNPAKSLLIAGVTGTNGKSTTAFIIHHLMNKALKRCGLMGTMFYDLGGPQVPATHTTPESLEIQGHLATMTGNGCRALAMEISSHALHQDRVHGLPIKVGIFTNLTQDHLDYHGTLDEYFEAKCILFQTIADQPSGQMVINADDPWGRKLINRFESTKRITTYGVGANCDFRASNIRYDLTGTTFELNAKGRQYLVRTPLIGDFNVYNVLAALGAIDSMSVNFREAIQHLKSTPQVPGRLERVSADTARFQVFVDYAHTPDALVNVLKTVRALRPRNVITVFGCGGDRDRTKRPLMARAVEDGSDVSILTSDNPRNEEPSQIIADASKGFVKAWHLEIESRAEAISAAITNARPGDIVLIAGKGHEDYQEIKGQKLPFDDRRIAHGCLAARRDEAGQARLEKLREREQREERDKQQEFFEKFHEETPIVDDRAGDSTRPKRRWNQ